MDNYISDYRKVVKCLDCPCLYEYPDLRYCPKCGSHAQMPLAMILDRKSEAIGPCGHGYSLRRNCPFCTGVLADAR